MNSRLEPDKKPQLSALERWRNICDAIAETTADDPQALRDYDDYTPFSRKELSLKAELSQWARESQSDESREEQIFRLKEKIRNLIIADAGFEAMPAESPEEHISRFIQTIGRLMLQIQGYLEKINELEKAAGLPLSIKTERPSQEPSKEGSNKSER